VEKDELGELWEIIAAAVQIANRAVLLAETAKSAAVRELATALAVAVARALPRGPVAVVEGSAVCLWSVAWLRGRLSSARWSS